MWDIITPKKDFSGVVTQSVNNSVDLSGGTNAAVLHNMLTNILVFL